MTAAGWAVDLVLGVLLVGLAWRSLGTRNLLEAVVLFVALGLVLSLTWVRLGAPDIALAEAALGAGVTGALFLNALRRLARKRDPPPHASTRRTHSWPTRLAVAGGGVALAAWVGWVLVILPERAIDLPALVGHALPRSGVENPVTAVLLNFRAYDTLMEVAVLLLVASALWALDPRETLAGASGWAGLALRPSEPGRGGGGREPVLDGLVRLAAPLIVVTASYLAWAGSRLPGGAFQAGALLGGGGVLLLMAGRLRLSLPPALWLRAGIVAGFALFLLVGAGGLMWGGAFLEYPPAMAYPLILAVEAFLTISVACVLMALFAEVPSLGRPAPEPELAKPVEGGEEAS